MKRIIDSGQICFEVKFEVKDELGERRALSFTGNEIKELVRATAHARRARFAFVEYYSGTTRMIMIGQTGFYSPNNLLVATDELKVALVAESSYSSIKLVGYPWQQQAGCASLGDLQGFAKRLMQLIYKNAGLEYPEE